MSNTTNTAATPQQNLDSILTSKFWTLVSCSEGDEKAKWNTIYQSLEAWSESNSDPNRVFNDHEELNLSQLWNNYFNPTPEELNNGEKHKARLLPEVTEIERRIKLITGSNRPRQHTTVYDGGACQICEQNGGGSYGPNVPAKERRHHHH
ncbi:hypothetical protein QBC45DRAFT_69024 [Copromyces sp. CBS 386.78]|nr:hypothetical protein QBC45DRAFT_69024 [Copromyces sp. CBS 386.78]